MGNTFYSQNDYRNYLAHYGVPGMKWGVRKDRSKSLGYATRIAMKAKVKERRLTRDVTSAVKAAGGSMHGLEHRLKTLKSIRRKIDTDALEKRISPKQAAADIKDAVRYTSVTSDKNFVRCYSKTRRALERQGYTEIRCKNYFSLYAQGKAKHKSVQSVFEDRTGYRFELQFQTPASQRAKDEKVPLYEERRKPGLSPERQQELERQMDILARRVPDPPGVERIQTH